MSQPITLTLTEDDIEGLRAYVQWYGAAHQDDCPGDDTCDCICKPLNDAVNAVCQKAFDAQVAPMPMPIPLTAVQEQAIKDWAADDRLWTTQETVEVNLRTFAREILKHAFIS